VCIEFLRKLPEVVFILRRNERDMIENVYRSSCTVPVISVRLQWNFNFPERISEKNPQCQISLKSVQWEPSYSMRTNRRTERHGVANRRFSPEKANPWQDTSRHFTSTQGSNTTPRQSNTGLSRRLESEGPNF